MWMTVGVRGGVHDGCCLRVPPDLPASLWLPAEWVADLHAVYSFMPHRSCPTEYRLDAPPDETPLCFEVAD